MIKSKFILITLIFSLNSFLGLGQKVDYRYADTLYSQGQVDLALKEYLRVYHFHKFKADNDLLLKIALIYGEKQNFDKSNEFLDICYFRSIKTPSFQNEISYLKIQNLLKQNNPNDALIILYSTLDTNEEDKDRRLFYEGFIHIINKNFSQSKEAFSALSFLSDKEKEEINVLVNKIQKQTNKKAYLPAIASSLIPGIGQTMNGDMIDGLKSFGLITGLVFVFYDIQTSISTGNALLSVGPWLMRYYIGGIDNARKGYLVKKTKKLNTLNEKLIHVIQNAQKT